MNNQIEIYRSQDGSVQLNVKLENETVWLTQSQMAELFGRDRTVITRHINNCYKEGELDKKITCAKFAHMGKDQDQTYETTMYNLDVIISVGYRVKSIQGNIVSVVGQPPFSSNTSSKATSSTSSSSSTDTTSLRTWCD